MSISTGQIIVANDIYDKFMSDMSVALTDLDTDIDVLASALPATETTPPIYKYYVDAKTTVIAMIDKLKELETTKPWQLPESTTARHLHDDFDGTEASGRVTPGDFIGAYHLSSFIEGLHAVAANLRLIEISFEDKNKYIDLTTDCRIPFNDFALNNNNSTANGLAAGTVYAGQLASDYYINLNKRGRQYISNLTAVKPDDTTLTELRSDLTLDDYYNTTPADWHNTSDTGIVNQYNQLSAIKYPYNPEEYEWNPIDTISQKLESHFTPTSTSDDKIYSKTEETKQLIGANTVQSLFAECNALLNSLKTDLRGIYEKEVNVEIPVDSLAFTEYCSLGYPYMKHWFVTKKTGTAGGSTSLKDFAAHDNAYSGLAPNSNVPQYYDGAYSLRNDEFAPTEDYIRTDPIRVGYKHDTTIPVYNNASGDWYCPMPLTYTKLADTGFATANGYLNTQPSTLYHTTSGCILLDKVSTESDVSNNAAAYTNMRRVLLCKPQPNATTGSILDRYTFLSSYKALYSGANGGVITDTAHKYYDQCVITANCSDDNGVISLYNSVADITNVVSLALAKKQGTSPITVITSPTDMPDNIAFTLTSWASINEVNRTHGTTALATYGIDNINIADAKIAVYDHGHATTATVPLSSGSNNDTLSAEIQLQHFTTNTTIKNTIGNAMYAFRRKFVDLYGADDVLAKDDLSWTTLQTVLNCGTTNQFFQGCAGGAIVATYILKKKEANNKYGADTIPTFKFSAALSAAAASTGEAEIAVSQGYIGYEGFQLSYDVDGSALTSTITNNSLRFVPLPADASAWIIPGPSNATTYYMKLSSTNWWDTAISVDILSSDMTQITGISISNVSDLKSINTGIALSDGDTDVKIKIYNKATAGSLTLSGGHIVTPLSQETYNIIFDPNGGTPTTAITLTDVKEGKPTTLPACSFSKLNNVFTGWKDSENVEYADTASVTLYRTNTALELSAYTLSAQWDTPQTYTIQFDPGIGGTGAMPDITDIVEGTITALDPNTYLHESLTFAHWKDSNNVTYDDGANITLYRNNTALISGVYTLTAQWE